MTTHESFAILSDAEGIRKNVHIYLGEQGNEMAFRALSEIVDNARDEAIAGRNSYIEVRIDYASGNMTVLDKGRGIPVTLKDDKHGPISILTAVFTKRHAGAKFNQEAYKTSSGTHGIGATCVAAVSDILMAYTYQGKQWYAQRFENGEPTTDVIKVERPKVIASDKAQYGTVVMFRLDQSIVSESAVHGALPDDYITASPDQSRLAHWLELMAMLNPNLKVRLRTINGDDPIDVTYENKGSVADIAEWQARLMYLENTGKVFNFHNDYVTCSLGWADGIDASYLSLVNGKPTSDGGWHVVGLTRALMGALSKHLTKDTKITSADLMFGSYGVFDWRMHKAAFTSQVKDKLASRVDKEVREMLQPELEAFFDKNPALAKQIVTRAQAVVKSREDFEKTVKAVSEHKKRGNTLPSDLSVANKAKPEDREIYFVEGDSAKGTADDSRDTRFQEVLPCQGKSINVLKKPMAAVLANKSIAKILVALGADVKTLNLKSSNPTFDISKFRTHKVIILVDPDPDGDHISVLILSALWRLAPDLFKAGRVFCVDMPLYAAVKDGIVYRGSTFQECRKNAPRTVKDHDITRIKGLGEVNHDVLRPIAFDVHQRKLIRITSLQDTAATNYFLGLVAGPSECRKQLLGLS